MDRIQNDYCWSSVKDWQKAQEMGLVGMHDFLQGNEDEKLLEMIELAVNDCLPLHIMCIKTDKNKYIMADALTRLFWQFINNEIPVMDNNNKKTFFRNFSPEKQNKILEAKINSVWFRI